MFSEEMNKSPFSPVSGTNREWPRSQTSQKKLPGGWPTVPDRSLKSGQQHSHVEDTTARCPSEPGHREGPPRTQGTRQSQHGHRGTMNLHASETDYFKRRGVKPDPQGHTVCDCTSGVCPELDAPQRQEVLPGAGGRE